MLSWHVEYWDYLGWRDPFAHPAHTDRQKRYARALGAGGLVTPQILVANADARGRKIADLLSAESAKPPRLAIDGAARATDGKVELEVRLRRLDPSLELASTVRLRPVLYQRKAVTSCGAGENKGATLVEHYVVRQALDGADPTPALADAGTRFHFVLPADLKGGDAGVAVLVEDEATMKTLECRAFPVQEGDEGATR